MAEIIRLSRKFRYGALDLEDPGREMSPEEVKDFYANIYPELTQASIEGPEYQDDEERYEFRKTVGTKGVKKGITLKEASELEAGEDADLEFMRLVYAAIFQSGGDALIAPSEAQGMI